MNKERYEVALSKKNDPKCYVTFHKCNSFAEAKQKCIAKGDAEGRECVVLDNEDAHLFVFRHKPVCDKEESVIKDDKTPIKPRPKYNPVSRR
jgi:hypothetical protein